MTETARCRECGRPRTDRRDHLMHHAVCPCVCYRCAHRIVDWLRQHDMDWLIAREGMTAKRRRQELGI